MSESTATLWAVFIGAILATVGGFAATRLEEVLRRRERERGAALLFGEILSAIELISGFARQARMRGDPYGPVTMRLMRGIRRETDVYDRNRELLYDLRDAVLRARIHTLAVRLTMALDGVFDSTDQIALERSALSALPADHPTRTEAVDRLAAWAAARETAFEFALDTIAEAASIITALRPLARQTFDAQATVAREALANGAVAFAPPPEASGSS